MTQGDASHREIQVTGRYKSQGDGKQRLQQRLFQSDIHDFDVFVGFVGLGMYFHFADLLANFHATCDPPKHSVLAV